MIIPRYLTPNSKIRIVSPAGKIKEEHLMPAVDWLRKQGYTVVLGKHVFAQHYQFAGTDMQRLSDLQEALDDPEADAVVCSRGGYGTVRIVNKIDFTKFPAKPKWLVGFSDITILHACLNKLNVATIHGVMPRYFFDDGGHPSDSLNALMKLLRGQNAEYSIPAAKENRTGEATAELVGGNLSIISSLQGTKYELETDGKILFLEEIDEFLYHTDRMMQQLKMAGKLNKLAGLVVGDFTDMKDNESPFGKTAHEIITEAADGFDYPVCFGFPAGHHKTNLALTFGKVWELKVAEKQATLHLL